MKGCILDKRSFDRDDIAVEKLTGQLPDWRQYESSEEAQVKERISGCDVVITNKVRLSRQTIENANELKLILIAATGTDNVDLKACKDQGVVVCNARQYSNPAVVQHTFNLILCLMSNFTRYQSDVESGKWSESDVFCLLDYPIRELAGRSIGIIGYGNLGRAVASVAKAFGMKVNLCQRPNTEPVSGRLPLHELLSVSDIVSLHCPLTTDTHHLINHSTLSMMKSESILINTARGAIIEPESLVSALRQGTIGGAGIDVLDVEPPPKDHPLLESGIPNLIVTPHNAWGTQESRQRLVDQMADNLKSWREGSPKNAVT